MTQFATPYRGILDQLNIPTVLDWSEHLHDAYLKHDSDYATYISNLESLDSRTATIDQTLEKVVNLSVEGQFERALSDLKSLNPDGWETKRTIAFFRLRGCLERQMGAGDSAHESYTRALKIAESANEGQVFNWVVKALKFDLFQMAAENHLLGSVDMFDEQQRIQAVDAWFSNPAFDIALSNSASNAADESFQEYFKKERTTRWRGGLPSELRWFNAAAALAYLCGDYSDVRRSRLQYGRQESINALRTNDIAGFAQAIHEFIRARAHKELSQLLPVTGHQVTGYIDIDQVAINLRPIQPLSSTAQKIYDTALSFITEMAEYLTVNTRERLTEEFLRETLEFLKGEQTHFVRPLNRTEGKFIKTFRRVANFNLEQLRTLVAVLEQWNGSHPAETFWELLLSYSWQEEQEADARNVFRIIRLKSKSLITDNIGLSSVNTIFEIFARISRVFPAVGEEIDAWLLSDIDGLKVRLGFWYFLDRRHDQAVEFVREHIDGLVSKTVTFMENTEPKGSISIFQSNPVYYLSPAYKYYGDVFSEEQKVAHLVWLLEASRNRAVDAEYKGAVFDGVADALDELRDRTAILVEVAERNPLNEQTRHFGGSLFRTGAGEDTARLFLLNLKLKAGGKPSPDHLSQILGASLSTNNETVRTAIEVIGTCIKLEYWVDRLTSVILSLLHHDAYTVRARAAYVAIESHVFSESEVQNLGYETLLDLMSAGHPFVIQTVMANFAHEIESIPPKWLTQIYAQSQLSLESSHSGVRRYAQELLETQSSSLFDA